MKYIINILAVCLLFSCSKSVKIDIEGRLTDKAASMVYLVVDGIVPDTLAAAPIADDNSFRLRGDVAEPTTAFICDDNGNTLSMLLTESAKLRLRPVPEGGYITEGGPINDKYNLAMSRLSDIARQIMALDPDEETAEEEYESLIARYHDILTTTITDNLDNIVGVELFLAQESNGMSAQDMRVRMSQFSQQMQNLAPMKQFAEYIEQYARTEVGQPFIDMELNTITGGKMLSEVCKGKWVLLDFWATWCAPCMNEIPHLKAAYEKFHNKGFEIYAISIDHERDAWTKVIKEKELQWVNVLREFSEATALYGVRGVPSNYLIDCSNGIIIANHLRGEELLNKLEEVIK